MSAEPHIITYSLRNGQPFSDSFYADLPAFTDRLLAFAETRTGEDVRGFMAYRLEHGGEAAPNRRPALRTPAEYTYELLSLGVLWRVYAGRAVRLGKAPARLLAKLSALREILGKRPYLGWAKRFVDGLRGWLAAFYLGSGKHAAPILDPSLEGLDRLLAWLDASGDFTQIGLRLSFWRDYLSQLPPPDGRSILTRALSLAEWFESASLEALGEYTPHVVDFLSERHPAYAGREDYIFCGRKRVEYHLNMIGSEILNRTLRPSFEAAPRKVVLLPPCMSHPAEKCQAVETPLGARCAACTPGCRVNQITRLGEKHGFDVFFLPGELGVYSPESSQGAAKLANGDVGVVGVSCVLTNPSGGFQMKTLGVPAQGLFLDYVGCEYHWQPDAPIPTDINLHRLADLLGLELRSRSARHSPA
jgi:hypothetical protein